MLKQKIAKDQLHFLHSDELLKGILNESNEYLEENEDLIKRIKSAYWILLYLNNLIPQTFQSWWSGNMLPITEARYEFECSIALCKLGFYKHAISSLRSVLELGLLSVYWDDEDEEAKNWFKSIKRTPFKRIVFNKLKTISNVRTFDEKQKIFNRTDLIYERLSNFEHTKGFSHSSRKLNKNYSNVNNFNDESFLRWLVFMNNIIEIIIIFHVLKYPIGLQDTPIVEKFGINGPMGGFLQVSEMREIKKFLSKEVLEDLQEISDSDPSATDLAKLINDQPNITEAEFWAQIEKEDKAEIEMSGFSHWLKNQKNAYKSIAKNDPKGYQERLKYFKKMKIWAKNEGYFDKKINSHFS
jgi:hypothetical protein